MQQQQQDCSSNGSREYTVLSVAYDSGVPCMSCCRQARPNRSHCITSILCRTPVTQPAWSVDNHRLSIVLAPSELCGGVFSTSLTCCRCCCVECSRSYGRPNRPHYAYCASVSPSVCPIRVPNSKTKRRRKIKIDVNAFQSRSNRCAS